AIMWRARDAAVPERRPVCVDGCRHGFGVRDLRRQYVGRHGGVLGAAVVGWRITVERAVRLASGKSAHGVDFRIAGSVFYTAHYAWRGCCVLRPFPARARS